MGRIAEMDLKSLNHKKKVLGKGLESLIPTQKKEVSGTANAANLAKNFEKGLVQPTTLNINLKPAQAGVAQAVGSKNESQSFESAPLVPKIGEELKEVKELYIEQIVPCKDQPRREFDPIALNELAQSIEQHGVLQPIIVRRMLDSGKYEIVVGERRWRASQQAGLKKIPVLVKDFSGETQLEVALIENIQRQNLNAMEEARAYAQLMTMYGLSHEDISKKVGKNRSTITNSLRLLKLPHRLQDLLKDEKISVGHAKVLLGLNDLTKILQLGEEAYIKQWSVRDLEKKIAQELQETSGNSEKNSDLGNENRAERVSYEQVAQKIRAKHHFKIKVLGKNGKGKFVIGFKSSDEFENILKVLES